MTPEQITERSRWIALYVLCAGVLMIVLDVTIVNVALPSIHDDLIGRRTIFLAGLFVFTVASLACGLAESQGMLVAARFVQGVGGAMTSAVVLGMIVTMFGEPRERARAIGIYSFVAAAGA